MEIFLRYRQPKIRKSACSMFCLSQKPNLASTAQSNRVQLILLHASILEFRWEGRTWMIVRILGALLVANLIRPISSIHPSDWPQPKRAGLGEVQAKSTHLASSPDRRRPRLTARTTCSRTRCSLAPGSGSTTSIPPSEAGSRDRRRQDLRRSGFRSRGSWATAVPVHTRKGGRFHGSIGFSFFRRLGARARSLTGEKARRPATGRKRKEEMCSRGWAMGKWETWVPSFGLAWFEIKY